jgi:hypothetical protein
MAYPPHWASICQLGVELPISDAVRRVCHEGLPPAALAKELISRPRRTPLIRHP